MIQLKIKSKEMIVDKFKELHTKWTGVYDVAM